MAMGDMSDENKMEQNLAFKDKRKIGHRRINDEGEITYKKINTNQIMCSIQLGIEKSIAFVNSSPDRDLLMKDFMTVESFYFPSHGTNCTPAHRYSDFKFKTYASISFRHFRALFGIEPDEYLSSMCSSSLNELGNPGASGSVFYVTQDGKFIIKTVQHKEGQFLQKLLPGYYMNLHQNFKTLLPRFYGLYCYHCNSKNIRLVVMNNFIPTNIEIHEKYDLKGSKHKRQVNESEKLKPQPTYKDLDFLKNHPNGIFLQSETYNLLIKTIQRDCRVLESFKIMDYSLLLGIHYMSEMETYQNFGLQAQDSKGNRLVLFIGIIDILQSYRLKKKVEHTLKSMFYDGDEISVHRPSFYSQRFQKFMSQVVFKKQPKKKKKTNNVTNTTANSEDDSFVISTRSLNSNSTSGFASINAYTSSIASTSGKVSYTDSSTSDDDDDERDTPKKRYVHNL